MAVTKILAKTTRLDHLVRYLINPKKTDEQVFVSSVGCVPESAARTWMDTKRRFGRTEGVQAYHMIQSFQPGEITPELAHEIGNRFAQKYLDRFEVIVGTHVDKAHVHNHIIFNSVSDRDGHKYHSSPTSYFREIRGLSDALCREYGLSVIGEPERHALTYVEWRMKKLSIRTQKELVDREVEECLPLAMDVGGFYALMEDRGYTILHRSRYPTFVPYGDEQGHRARVKGKAMTEDDLIAYIDRAMTDPTFEVIMPRQQRVHIPRGKVTGFRACVLAWAYILGLINDGIKPQYHVPPKELKRFEQLKKQAAYLTDHKLDTLAQVDARIADLNRQIDYQTKHRIILNGQKKRQKPLYDALQLRAMYRNRDRDALPLSEEEQKKMQKAEQLLSNQPIDILKLERERLYADLVEVNQALRDLKRELHLCEQIEADSTHIHENLRPFLTDEMELKHEFMDYER
ncbi:MAG: relaxase/mobilization nuclease domain-containing protein [Anaerolineaceae bacterium]|nr:relaxase/mobilization nuclease domain-containing protein [Anaerolineaceae bacterium]